MFNDFHENPRSVGIAGLLLALLVLAGFCGLGMAVMSGDVDSSDPSMASKIIDRDRMIEQLSSDIQRGEEKLAKGKKNTELTKALNSLTQNLNQEEKENTQLQSSLQQLNHQLSEMQQKHELYRERYRRNERGLAIGEIIDLSETLGDDYKKSKIREISPLHLRVMKASGPIGIPYEQLPSSVQDRFQFSEQEATAFREKMKIASEKRGIIEANHKKKRDKKRSADQVTFLEQEIQKKREEIREKLTYASKMKNTSADFERKAREIEREVRRAKANGRISSGQGKVRQARSKASLYSKRSMQAKLEIVELQRELSQLKTDLKAVKR